jgi:hypothetical protein
MKTKEVNGTVNWKRLRNMFILMIVMVEDDLNLWLVGNVDAYLEPNTTSRQQTGYLTSQFVKRSKQAYYL